VEELWEEGQDPRIAPPPQRALQQPCQRQQQQVWQWTAPRGLQAALQPQQGNWAQRAAAAAALPQTEGGGFNRVGRGGKVAKEPTGLEWTTRSIPWDERAILFERSAGAPQIDAVVAVSAAAQVNIALSKVAPPPRPHGGVQDLGAGKAHHSGSGGGLSGNAPPLQEGNH